MGIRCPSAISVFENLSFYVFHKCLQFCLIRVVSLDLYQFGYVSNNGIKKLEIGNAGPMVIATFRLWFVFGPR